MIYNSSTCERLFSLLFFPLLSLGCLFFLFKVNQPLLISRLLSVEEEEEEEEEEAHLIDVLPIVGTIYH